MDRPLHMEGNEMTTQEAVLCKLLNCGYLDLQLLDDIQYDLDDILEDMVECVDMNINSIFREVFRKGAEELHERYEMQKDDIRDLILEEIGGFEAEAAKTQYDYEADEDYLRLKADLDMIESNRINPNDDLSYYLNYTDTHVLLPNKQLRFFRRWIEVDIKNIEDKMG